MLTSNATRNQNNWTPKWTWWEAWDCSRIQEVKKQYQNTAAKEKKKQNHVQPWTRHSPPVIIDKFLPTINTRRFFFCQNSGSGRTRSSGKPPPRNQSPTILWLIQQQKKKKCKRKARDSWTSTHTHNGIFDNNIKTDASPHDRTSHKAA
jgi:hypothetical protein